VQRLADVREAFGFEAQLPQALLQRDLPVDGAEVVGDRRDRATVEVQPAVRIASRTQGEERPPRRPVSPGRVRVVEGLRHCSEPGPEERDFLAGLDAPADQRLACQVTVHGDVDIEYLGL